MASALIALSPTLDLLFGRCVLTAYYGWAANLHRDLCWMPMKIHPDTLQFFIEDSIDQRIIVPGQSDLLIDSPQEELRLLFCHESDIHVDGKDEDLMKRFMESEPYSQFRFYSKAELNEPGRNQDEPQKGEV
jgi:hypothetical protein